jgi:hypothetical protein
MPLVVRNRHALSSPRALGIATPIRSRLPTTGSRSFAALAPSPSSVHCPPLRLQRRASAAARSRPSDGIFPSDLESSDAAACASRCAKALAPLRLLRVWARCSAARVTGCRVVPFPVPIPRRGVRTRVGAVGPSRRFGPAGSAHLHSACAEDGLLRYSRPNPLSGSTVSLCVHS